MDFQLLKVAKGDEDVRGWWLSEKLDGWRAAWIAEKLHFVTRGGKIIAPPEWFADLMPHDIDLDGELWAGRRNISIIASLIGDNPQWKKIEFRYFSRYGKFADFYEAFVSIPSNRHLHRVQHVSVQGWNEIASRYVSIIKIGGEGVVIRNLNEPVRPGRSDRVLKIKPPPFFEGDPTKWTATKANEFLKLANAR